MDRTTIEAYNTHAADFAVEWEDTQSAPVDLREIIGRFFVAGATVDIGCGSGRDTAWLAGQGFDVTGVDASVGLIEEARRRHPGVRFSVDTLPELASLEGTTFVNVLCETVIMHFDTGLIEQSVRRLVSLLSEGGVLYLTWRVTNGDDVRDAFGRMYAAFEPSLVLDALTGTEILLNKENISASSGKTIHRIVARRLVARA